MFGDIFRGRRVLVTGHTGFKGTWLTSWLLHLGAQVTGLSRDIPTQPSMFEVLGLSDRMRDIRGDVRDLSGLRKIVAEAQPEFVFHLAAQAIVATAYSDPVETMTTNIVGTMNVLEVLRTHQAPCMAVLITSDKCYDNVEWVWGYRETDRMGGADVYSGSKGAAELVIRSYVSSFFNKGHPVRVGIGRAGNVIGGGDWAQNRIVVDCMRAWSAGVPVEIRSPAATRPWQHVLEPLSGYLALGAALTAEARLHGEAFNFGPRAEQNRTVVELLADLGTRWGLSGDGQAYRITDNIPFHEAGLLKLNCDKALFHLRWEPTLDYPETIEMIGDWYHGFYREHANLLALTMAQISAYERHGAQRGRVWAQS